VPEPKKKGINTSMARKGFTLPRDKIPGTRYFALKGSKFVKFNDEIIDIYN